MTTCSWTALLVAALLPGKLSAQAGSPYQTDDPDPVEYRHWEFYVAAQLENSGGALVGTAPHVEVNYGAAPQVQLHLLVPRAYARPAHGPSTHGLGDIELGAKLQFVEEGRWRPMVGTFVQTRWPAGSTADGLGTGRLHALLPIWIQKRFGPWTSDAGGGFWINPGEGNRNFWVFGWQVARRISELATVGTELFHTGADEAGGTGTLRWNTGLVINVTGHHHLLLSAGRSVAGERVTQGYVGYQLTVGPSGEPPQ